jgi:uncharacterized protein YprB with RNaseH-like and TPR domain
MVEPELVRDPMPEPFWPAGLPRPRHRASGALSTFTTRFEGAYRHGPWSMAEIVRRATAELAQLAGGAAADEGLDWERALFLDLEAGGHPRGGSCIHVAGLARFVATAAHDADDEFRGFEVVQLVAHTEAGERALLETVARAAADATALVTYSGKSFDAPLLAERARSHALELALPRRHFDLYRMGTKLLRRRFSDTKLVTLERELLRYERVLDLPGIAVPWAFRTASEDGIDALLWAIVRHNLLDVVALPALAAELTLRLESPEESLEQSRLDEQEAAGIAESLEEAKRALEVAPPYRREAARRKVRRLEKRLQTLQPDAAEAPPLDEGAAPRADDGEPPRPEARKPRRTKGERRSRSDGKSG